MAEQKATLKGAKRWCKIAAPAFLSTEPIGETITSDPRKLVGKFMSTSLATITGEMKHQSVSVKLRVTEIADGTALTDFYGFSLAPSSIKRLVRRNSNRLDDSFICTTGDGKIVRVKPIILTASKTNGMVQRALRHLMIALIVKEIGSVPFEETVKNILTYKLQSNVRTGLRKTYPVKYFEIKTLVQSRRGKPVKVEEIPAEQPAEDDVSADAEA